MTTPDPNILIGALSAVALWAAYHYIWKAALLTLFRQRLFHLRDLLFFDAAAGKLSFDDDAYGMLREMTNSTIRASRSLTAGHLFLFWAFGAKLRTTELRLDRRFALCLERMQDQERAARYRAYHGQLMLACAKHLVRMYRPPIVGVIAIELATRLPIKAAARAVNAQYDRHARSAARYVEAAMLVSGEDDTPLLAAA